MANPYSRFNRQKLEAGLYSRKFILNVVAYLRRRVRDGDSLSSWQIQFLENYEKYLENKPEKKHSGKNKI